MPWDFALIIGILGFLVPWLGKRRITQLFALPNTAKRDRLVLYASTAAFQWGAVGLVWWRATAHFISSRDLGVSMSRPLLTLVCSVLLCALFFVNQIVSTKRLAAGPPNRDVVVVHLVRKVFPQDGPERLAFAALVVSIAICEEVIYRGFVQFVSQQLISALVGILFSALLFALAHLYQGPRGMAATFVVGVAFAAARLWTGSLVPSIAAHFVTDFTIGVLAPIRIRMGRPFSEIERTALSDGSVPGEHS